MVGADGGLSMPWLAELLRLGLQRRAHALLLQGPEGVGQFELALALAQGWLCETSDAGPAGRRPCGICGSCRLVQARSHPDLLVLLPEALREALGWGTANGEGEEGGAEKAGKAKPSKEIKVEAVRAAVEFAQTTSARGRGKVVVLYPAERVNVVAANTLLKTLEEPPGNARFVLGTAAPDALLPTIRSRCQSLPLALPARDEAVAWLASRGVAEPAAVALLMACGGQPLQALQWSEEGVDTKLWQQIPGLLLRGEAAPLMNWPVPRLVETLQKVCHDVLCVSAGGTPRYFQIGSIRSGTSIAKVSAWGRELSRIARHAEHPWSAGLLVESLVEAARSALATPARDSRGGGGNSLHLRA